MTDRFQEAGQKFVELLRIMARLRAPGGCPWDQKQTFDSIKPHTLEETYEVLDAIDQRDWRALQDELGDLLMQPVFLAEIAAGDGLFTIADSIQDINDKLVRRHPHIFGEAKAETAEDVKKRWDEIKRAEKAERNPGTSLSALDGVLRNLPALVEAEKISGKAGEVGFEWPTIEGVLQKVAEEAEELAAARETGNHDHLEHELGDLLFTVVNLGRYLRVDSEQALRKANARFRNRFRHVEQGMTEWAGSSQHLRLERMEQLWQEAKAKESQ